MKPDAWDRTTKLFAAALEKPEQARDAFLLEHCDDPALRADIEELLKDTNDVAGNPGAARGRDLPVGSYDRWSTEQLLDALATGEDQDSATIRAMIRALHARGVLGELSRAAEEARRLRGIRGWLLVFVVFTAVLTLNLAYSVLDPMIGGRQTLFAALGLPLSVYGGYTFFLLAAKRPRAPAHARLWLALVAASMTLPIVVSVVDFGLMAFGGVITADDLAGLGLYMLIALAWMAYVSRSRRVAHTYGSARAGDTPWSFRSQLALLGGAVRSRGGLGPPPLTTADESGLDGVRGWLLVFVLFMGLFALELLLVSIAMWWLERRSGLALGIVFFILGQYGLWAAFLLVRRWPRALYHARLWLALGLAAVVTHGLVRLFGRGGLSLNLGLWLTYVPISLAYLSSSRRVAETYGPRRSFRHEAEIARSRHVTAGAIPERRVVAPQVAVLSGPFHAIEDLTTTVGGSAPSGDLPSHIEAYRIVRLLGEGGMGRVYLAEQQRPKRFVALKVIRPGLASAEVLQRFRREADVLGRLQHPGVARIYEAGTAITAVGEQPFFAMEFIAGEPLLSDVARRRLDTRQRLELVAKVCDAVHHAHQRGIIHRDLKPANILVDETGQPKILDFGIAHATELSTRGDQTMVGQLIGTLAYMSPEQALADPHAVDIRSDVYAIGVILYQLLAGRLPYSLDEQPWQRAVQTVLQQEPASLGTIDRTYRGDIETIVAKALEKDPERRYASASDFSADLRRHLDHQPVLARPASALYHLQKFAQRNRTLASSVSIVLVVLVVALAVAVDRREVVEFRSAASLDLVEVKPPPGSSVTKETIVVAELSYRIEQFTAERFVAGASAELVTGNSTINGSPDVVLGQATGRVTVAYPLADVWDHPELRKPLLIRFAVRQLGGSEGISAIVANAGPVTYRAGEPAVWPRPPFSPGAGTVKPPPPWFAGAVMWAEPGVTMPILVKRAQPHYPSDARAAKVTGEVHLDAKVDTDGRIRQVRVVRSIPHLDASAMEAAKRFEYRPAQRNGQAVPAIVRITVPFGE
jgi:TonB family protein